MQCDSIVAMLSMASCVSNQLLPANDTGRHAIPTALANDIVIMSELDYVHREDAKSAHTKLREDKKDVPEPLRRAGLLCDRPPRHDQEANKTAKRRPAMNWAFLIES